ncbi:CU044_2847 family protein [Streptomyces sp. NPDC055105]|uniref:CU044_2847 family protein n=1 Tax=Streptomyces sp. NPDC055105 TaxID=3365719 RepID=UPI0037D1C1A4
MTDTENYRLDDGTTVRFLLADADQSAFKGDGSVDGLGPVIPAGRRGEAVAAVAVGALRSTLRPLGPLVQEIHDAVSAVPSPPTEITVTFGVQLSQDLKLGIVNGNGQAHLTVAATWKPETVAPAQRANDHRPGGDGAAALS